MASDQFNSPFMIKPNLPPAPFDKQTHVYPQTPLLTKNNTDHQEDPVKDRRAMSSEKFNNFHNRDLPKQELISQEKPKKIESKMLILSGELSFK